MSHFAFWVIENFYQYLSYLFDRKLQVFKKWTIFGIFNELLSTQNVNAARLARNVE